MPSHALDHVALAARGLELFPQIVHRLPFVGDKLLDPRRHPVLDPRDLVADLLHIGLPASIALALPPLARVLVAQVSHRPSHPAVETELVTRFRAGDLLPAVLAEDKDGAHLDRTFKSATTASLSSRRRPGEISNTESGRPGAAQTTLCPSRSRSMNPGTSVAWPNGG